MFIYLIAHHETGRYYVGQHKGNNLKKYLQQKFHHAQRGISSNSRLYRSMRAHPTPASWSIHALRSDIQTREELDQTERDFIKFLRATDPEYGYNICRGGEGFTGPHTERAKKKMSANSRCSWQRPEYRQRIVQAIRERGERPETKERLSAISRCLWERPEHREKVLGALRGWWLGLSEKDRTARNDRISATLMGHQVSKEAIAKLSLAATGRPSPTKGKPVSEGTRAKIAASVGRLWEDPAYREHMAIAASRPKPYLRKRLCKHGHDTSICGRYPNGNCRGCHMRMPPN